jgi:cytoskeleton protein RodZ
MAAEAGGIGARLRAGREKLGLTVLQVAERIHTDPKIVEAIEAENYEALGAPVYARGHIRHYAELVGESAADLTAMYSDLSQVGQPDLTRIVKAPSPGDSNKLVAPALLVIAVFAVAGAIWWISALSKKDALADTHVMEGQAPAPAAESGGSAPPEAAQTPAQASSGDRGAPPGALAMQPRPNAGGATASQSRPGSTAPTSQSRADGGSRLSAHPRSTANPPSAGPTTSRATLTAPATTRTAPSSTTPNRLASASPTPTRPGSAAASPAPAAANTAAPSATAPSRPKNQAQVTLRYSADSWTEVYDATGARLFYDVGAANSVQTVVGTPPLRIVLGNASGVAVEFNGHNKPIATLSQPDGSVQFSINRSGQIVRAKPVADGG